MSAAATCVAGVPAIAFAVSAGSVALAVISTWVDCPVVIRTGAVESKTTGNVNWSRPSAVQL